MNDRTLGLLGIARRASALSLGHDAALSSVKEGKASVCILAS
ncbi:MAG TPA: 50S ribosomal protein L7ae, partial [Ruminococcaceae bacterium]|nr:50S ribosomal protein L7ae [Oscillospiraceae bacterium]